MLSMVILMIWGFNEKGDEMTREQAKIAHLVTDRAMLSSKNVKLEEQVKREKRKARSIVAMLFWKYKKNKEAFGKCDLSTIALKHSFQQAYKMLNDNA